MFAHAGTSTGVIDQGAFWGRLKGRLLFDRLGADREKWRVYYHDVPHLWLMGDEWLGGFQGQYHRIGKFEQHVAADRLPRYSFIEPRHVVPPWSSQHPSAGVSYGERLIARVYDALRANPAVFAKSLLLVVWDEHGGFYDHVVPPGQPGWQDGAPGVAYDVMSPDGLVGRNGFAFDRLGPRVPAVVVSPWIERGSVFGWGAPASADRMTFEHTSILKTVAELVGGVDMSPASARIDRSTSLARVVNRSAPRAAADLLAPLLPEFDRDLYDAEYALPSMDAFADSPAGDLVDEWIRLAGHGHFADHGVDGFRRHVGAVLGTTDDPE